MSEKKIFKFVFTAYVQTVTLALKFPCVVSVIWKRGQKVSQVKQRKQIEKGIVSFNQKLEIECNMSYDQKKQQFQEKKTKFSVLIFSQKGNKQAGEVYIDVSEILNQKQKNMKYVKPLQTCPDKNAKLTFEVVAYMKGQITMDKVSLASTRTYNIQANISQAKPDFKKKKIDPQLVEPSNQPPSAKTKQQNTIYISSQRNIIPKEMNKVEIMKVEEQNKKLKQQLKELRELETQNQYLKRQYEQNERKLNCYYKKKYEQVKKQYQEVKESVQVIKKQLKIKNQLEKQVCECKETMGRLLNFALMSNNNQLAEQFYNIYQMKT